MEDMGVLGIKETMMILAQVVGLVMVIQDRFHVEKQVIRVSPVVVLAMVTKIGPISLGRVVVVSCGIKIT
jgi:hypothetical protein